MASFQKRNESVVAVVRTNTAEYDKVDFGGMLQMAIAHLSSAGIRLPSSGEVFLKPNLVIPEVSTQSITTDPHFIAELICLLLNNGVKKVYVGESSASFTKSALSYMVSGMGEAVTMAGGELVDIDDPAERLEIPMPDSDIVDSISVPRKAYEADAIITFGKLKTHRIGAFTCSVKNYVGFIDQKTRLENHQTRLPKLVSELHLAMPETLCFGDGVIIGEGDGPDISKPRFLGVLLASNDPVALDVIGANLLRINVNELTFPLTAYSDGVGEIDISKIKILGTRPEEIAISIEKPNEVLYNRFPCHMVLGGMCEGCFAWFIGPALFWQRDGIWEKINQNVGKPTFMIGFNAVDTKFEQHLDEGPYFVIGDCAPEKFRLDNRVHYVKGCCPGPIVQDEVFRVCKIGLSE